MNKTQWGLFPPTMDWGLPAKRLAYNAYTQQGLSNVDVTKRNLVNLNYGKPGKYWGTTLLCTSKKEYQGIVADVCKVLQWKDAILVVENEILNERVITNTSIQNAINCTKWAKEVADDYGILTAQGGSMMPEFTKVWIDTLPKSERQGMVQYFKQNGFYVGNAQAGNDCRTMLQYCADNGIYNNFHWQQEYKQLPNVVSTITKQYGNLWIANENAVRTDSVEAVEEIMDALNGNVETAIWFNADMGRSAIELNEPQKQAVLKFAA